MNYGFVRVGAAVPALRVANCQYNANEIINIINKADESDVQILVFPELSITGYTCGDLFYQGTLIREVEIQLSRILENTLRSDIVIIIGAPVFSGNQLFSCGVVIQKGKILGAVPKTHVMTQGSLSSGRWFTSGLTVINEEINLCNQNVPFGTDLLFRAQEKNNASFGIEISQDMWNPLPPSSFQAASGAVILFNLSAEGELAGRHIHRKELIRQQSGRCKAGYVFTSSGVHESSTDMVFGGYSVIAENGRELKESERFSLDSQLIFSEIDVDKLASYRLKDSNFTSKGCLECLPIDPLSGTVRRKGKFRVIGFSLEERNNFSLNRRICPHPFIPELEDAKNSRCSEIFSMQAAGLAKRMMHTGLKHAVIGISGGLDSTLALLVTVRACEILELPPENIVAVTMPGFGTTDSTYANAIGLMEVMKVSIREIDIRPACIQHFKDIGHPADVYDTTYENVQARERTQILMDIANKIGGLVIGTGDLSELALGWCTYNGDHMSMYAVNSGVPKTLIPHLIKWVAGNVVDESAREFLYNVINTPITPELLPPDSKGEINQITEDIVGPYELHDFFLYHMIGYGASPKKILFLAEQAFREKYDSKVIKKWLKLFYKRFFRQQFKRSCLPDGPRIGSISLSPRGEWIMPSDGDAEIWLKELE